MVDFTVFVAMASATGAADAANLTTKDRAFVAPLRRGVNARAPAAHHRLPARSA
jgi:hypothetical protein